MAHPCHSSWLILTERNTTQQDIFFHESVVAPDLAMTGIVRSMAVQVKLELSPDNQGRRKCAQVMMLKGTQREQGGQAQVQVPRGRGGVPVQGQTNQGAMVTMKSFSMNQPFAGLVAHGYVRSPLSPTAARANDPRR